MRPLQTLRTIVPAIALALVACQSDPISPGTRDPQQPPPPPPPPRPVGTFGGTLTTGSAATVTGTALARLGRAADGSGGTIALTIAGPGGQEDVIVVHQRGGSALVGRTHRVMPPGGGDATDLEGGLLRSVQGTATQVCRATGGSVTLAAPDAEAARGRLDLTLACTALDGVGLPITWRVEAEFAARLAAPVTVPSLLRLPVGTWQLSDAATQPLPAAVWSVYDFIEQTTLERVVVTGGELRIEPDGRYAIRTDHEYQQRGVFGGRARTSDVGRCAVGATGTLGCVSTLYAGRSFTADFAHDFVVARLDAANVGHPALYGYRRAAP